MAHNNINDDDVEAIMEQKPREEQPGEASASHAPTTLATAESKRENTSNPGGTTDVSAGMNGDDVNGDGTVTLPVTFPV